MNTPKTIAHMQYQRMSRNPSDDSYFFKQGEEWVPVKHKDALQNGIEIGMGLWAMGVRHHDRIAVMSATRPEWASIDNGALNMGAAVVSIYPTSTAETTAYILQNSGAKVVFLETVEHWNILDQIRANLPGLEHVVMIDPTDVPTGDWLTLENIKERGRELIKEQPGLPDEVRAQVRPEDLASLMYTSGTTGLPKGVALTHEMLMSIVETVSKLAPLKEGDTGVIYLPMSHIMQRVNVYVGRHIGLIGYFAPSIYDFVETCQAANPVNLPGVPRMLEKIHSRIMAGLEQASPFRKNLFLSAIQTGRQRVRLELAGQPVPFGLKAKSALFEKLVYSKIRGRLFGDKIEFLTSGAAPISEELLEFYYAIGLPIYEGYGLTETSSPITLNLPDRFKLGTVGPALPGCEVKIADDGEVLLKGPSVFKLYYNNPEATADAFTEDGWFKSGDIGELDEEGFLRITDRKKYLIITAGGKNIAPAPIEQKLIQHPLIGQIVVHGDQRKYLSALFTLDPESLEAWAAQNKKAHLSPAELAADPILHQSINEHVDAVNGSLARYETIKKFTILPEEFTIDNGYLTSSMKLKRKVVEKDFSGVLDGMYSE